MSSNPSKPETIKIWTGPENRMLLVTTESGARYEFRGRLMTKYDRTGEIVEECKAYAIKAVPTDVQDKSEIYKIPESYPEVGKLLYVSGYEMYWLTTQVVAVEEISFKGRKPVKNEA